MLSKTVLKSTAYFEKIARLDEKTLDSRVQKGRLFVRLHDKLDSMNTANGASSAVNDVAQLFLGSENVEKGFLDNLRIQINARIQLRIVQTNMQLNHDARTRMHGVFNFEVAKKE